MTINSRLKSLSLALFVLALTFTGVGILLGQGHGHGGKSEEVQITGEKMDLQCYLVHPENGKGEDHAKCAKMCINKGLPAGLLTDSGDMYLLLGASHESVKTQVADYAGTVVKIRGVLTEENGMKAIQVKGVDKE